MERDLEQGLQGNSAATGQPADSLQKQVEQGEGRDAKGRFSPGHSGNPAGRVAGSRNRSNELARQMIDNEAEILMRTVLDRALYSKDSAALRLCIERIIPPRRDEAPNFELPALEDANDATNALAAIVKGVATGDLTAAEAGHLSAVVDRFIHSLEARQLEARLTAIEELDARLGRK